MDVEGSRGKILRIPVLIYDHECYTSVHSSYCMHEFEVALHHNILVKRKKRLIVLMALDNPADIYADDETSDTAVLRQYLRQYTYIDYLHADDWLDKLLYALPLRGMDRAEGADQETLNLGTPMLY